MRTKTPQLSDKILSVAARLFATQRFHEARMEDIASEAEVGKGTLYRYFKDKDELYLALLERASDDLIRRLDEAADCDAGSRERLQAIVVAIFAFFNEQPHLFDLIQHAEAMQRPGAKFPWQHARDHYRDLLLETIEQARVAGEFTIPDPETAVLMLQGGLRAIYRFTNHPCSADQLQRAVDVILYGAVRPDDEKGPTRSQRPIRSGGTESSMRESC